MMKKLRYILEAFVLLLFMGISKALPLDWASNIGGSIGRLIGPRLAVSRKARKHIEIALPHLSNEVAKWIITGMWENLGRLMMEYPHLQQIGTERTEIIGKDILKKYKEGPGILISGHFANWECCPPALFLQEDIKACPIYRAPNNPYSDKMLKNSRSLNGKIKTIPKSRSGTRNIVNVLKNNFFIGMLIDQKYNEGLAVKFFGRPAMTSPTFVQLAQKFGCPVIPLRIERIKGANFKITVLEPLDTKDKSAQDVIEEVHTLFEKWIQDKPEQWLWLHKRWGQLK